MKSIERIDKLQMEWQEIQLSRGRNVITGSQHTLLMGGGANLQRF